MVPFLASMRAPSWADYNRWPWFLDITLNTSPSGADVAGDQAGFPLLVTLGSQDAPIFAQAPSPASIRFSKPDGKPLPFQVESWDAAGRKACLWVGLDTLKGGRTDQKIRMYWGGDAADSSSGKAVFRAADGFQGVWHMDGGLADASTNAIVATDSGTASESEGRIGAARRFDNPEAYAATGKYIALGNPSALNIAGRITLEAWIKWARRDGHRIVVCHGSAPPPATGAAFETVLRVGETKDYRAGVWTGTSHYAALDAPAADSNAWVHLAGVYTGGAWLLYRNGVKVAETPADTNGAKPSPGNWRIGAEYASTVTRWFHGAIDEVRISGVARPAEWIKASYENQKSGQVMTVVGAPQVNGIKAVGLPSDRGTRPLLLIRRGQALFRSPTDMEKTFSAMGGQKPPLPALLP